MFLKVLLKRRIMATLGLRIYVANISDCFGSKLTWCSVKFYGVMYIRGLKPLPTFELSRQFRTLSAAEVAETACILHLPRHRKTNHLVGSHRGSIQLKYGVRASPVLLFTGHQWNWMYRWARYKSMSRINFQSALLHFLFASFPFVLASFLSTSFSSLVHNSLENIMLKKTAVWCHSYHLGLVHAAKLATTSAFIVQSNPHLSKQST